MTQKSRSRRFPTLVGLIVIALMLAACGGGGGNASPSASANQPSTQPSASETTGTETTEPSASETTGTETTEPSASASEGTASPIDPPATAVALDFWTPFTGADGDTMEELVNQFNSETPNVQVSIQRLDEYYTQINNAIAAGEMPDIMIMHIDQLARFAAEGELNPDAAAIQPLDELISNLGLSAGDFTEPVWNGSQWKGQSYGVPLDVHPATLYWNRSILDEAPTDRESFEAALQTCKDAGVTGPVWSNHFFSASLLWASLFYQGGGQWTNEDYSEATFNSEAGVQASNYMRGLIDAGLHPQDVEADAEVSSFESGQSCMAVTGIWQTNRFQNALGEDFGAAPIPQIFDQPGSWAGSHTLAIRTGLEGDELIGAHYFINWLTGHTLEWAAGGQLPARTDVREDPAFQEIADVPDIAAGIEGAQFPPPIPGSADLLGGPGGVTEKLLEVLTGGGDAQAGLDEAAATYTEILQEAKAKYGF